MNLIRTLFALLCLLGLVFLLNSRLDFEPSVTAAAGPGASFHIVQTGDTLESIARQYDTTPQWLRQANNLVGAVSVGQRLVIPNPAPTPSYLVGAAHRVDESGAAPIISYQVQEGDTLASVAQQFGATPQTLAALNNLEPDSELYPQQPLQVPNPNLTQAVELQAGTAETSVVMMSGASHPIQYGDSLADIARRYGVTVDTIRAANNIQSDYLEIGQVLAIPNEATTYQIIDNTRYINNNAPFQTALPAEESYQVQPGDSLASIAGQFQTTAVAIRRANNLPDSTLYEGQSLVIPAGRAPAYRSATASSGTITYRVRYGDTLTALAYRFYTTVDAVRRYNNLPDNNIYVGQILIIPVGDPNTPPGQWTGRYVVQPGDTLYRIAWRCGVTVAALKAANNLVSDTIYPGQVLIVPNWSPDPRPPVPDQPDYDYGYYRVRYGDTLTGLADRFGTTVEAIRRANNIPDYNIYVDEVLYIP